MIGRGWIATLVLIGFAAPAGCRSPGDRFNDFGCLFIPTLQIAPQSGAPRDAGERVADVTAADVRERNIFPEVVRRIDEIEGKGRVLVVEGAITRFRPESPERPAGAEWAAARSGILIDVRFVDHETSRIVDQGLLRGVDGEWAIEGAEPRIGRAAGAIVKHLWYNKSNKPEE
ncbi:MAG: hypothetical protein O7H41_21740 [Planctomycetota bacterium]|nr:hypothetical protein [Planctomycetota bacterium]